MDKKIVIRKTDDIERVSGVLVMNGYTVARTFVKNPNGKDYFNAINITGNGTLPKKKDTEEDNE